MSTTRLQIRDALAALVVSATGLAVHTNLDFALEDGALPCAAIVSGSDEVDGAGSSLDGLREAQTARFRVDVLVAGSADPEAAADAFEGPLRAALRAGPTLGGLALLARYAGGQWEFDLGDCAVRRLFFQVDFIS